MIDCGDTGTCLIPMWIQYLILVILLGLFMWKGSRPYDPYDR